MRRSILPITLALLMASIASAQSPQLLAKNPENPAEKPHPIALTKADVHVLLAGSLCQTTMTLTFSNDANRVLEGELVFPLPENATISAYALDVGGHLVESVTVEKEKARTVFETEVRKGIDPGMIEQVQGNNFRTRIFPIPANGSRTIRVQYVSQPTFKDDKIVYNLPVQWPGSTPELTLGVESFSKEAPKIENATGLEFTSQGQRHIATKRYEKASFAGNVTATLPASSMVQSIVEKRTHSTVSVENLDPKTADQFIKTDHYFVINDQLTPPLTAAANQPKPLRIAIAWDASLSRADIDHTKEFDLIKAHLKALGNVKVVVIPFSNVPQKEASFDVTNGDASDVIKFLSALPYDGGTNLSALWLGKLPASEKDKAWKDLPPLIGYYLLFTDGLSNVGPDLPAKAEVPVFTISNDPRSNYPLLRRIATDSGGQYLNLQTLSPEQALATLTEKPFSLLSIDFDKNEIADVYPRLPQPIQGRVTIAGRLLAKTAKLTLNYGRGGEITSRVPITLTQEGATDSNLVSRFWAQLKIADLSVSADQNEKEITALGKQFNLVTPYTSMIVLETVEQYLQHKIIPPKSRADVYAEFMKRIEQTQAVAQTEEKAKIDRVVAMWNARLAWWNQDFKYAADFKYRGVAGGGGGRGGGGGGLFGGGGGRGGGGGDRAPAAADPAEQANRGVDSPRPNAPAQRPASGPRAASEDAVSRVYDTRDLQIQVPDFSNAPTFSLSSAGGRAATRPQAGEHLFRREMRERSIDGVLAPETDEARIDIKPWSPDTPYLKALQSAPADQAYNVYLKERKSYESSPAFYLDCADFFAKSSPDLAVRILTDIPELALDDGRLLRIAAHRLQQLGQVDLAIDLFERVAKLRSEEPQSFRDLALALADRAEQKLAVLSVRDFPIEASRPAMADYQRALELLHKVVMNQWERFDEIEVIALTEANRIIARLNTFPEAVRPSNMFDPRLIKLLDPDLRIVMTWDTDNTDIDLHVTEPTGETCVYNHNRTTIGGALSKDFTQGYGPEEYLLKKLMPGDYKIQAHFYGSRDQKLIGPTTVQATIITHFGRADEKRQAITLRLKDTKEMVDIGTVTLKP
jgi:Ca-activated chloride channel family protein